MKLLLFGIFLGAILSYAEAGATPRPVEVIDLAVILNSQVGTVICTVSETDAFRCGPFNKQLFLDSSRYCVLNSESMKLDCDVEIPEKEKEHA